MEVTLLPDERTDFVSKNKLCHDLVCQKLANWSRDCDSQEPICQPTADPLSHVANLPIISPNVLKERGRPWQSRH